MAKFAKGQSGNPSGRKKGTPNKATIAIKEHLLQALNEASTDGAVGYLKWLANEEPKAFAGLIGKIIPTQVTGVDDAPIAVNATGQIDVCVSESVASLIQRIKGGEE